MAGFDGPADTPDETLAMESSAKAENELHVPNGDKNAVAQALKETEVGITEYVNAALIGFSGILKKR